MQSYARLVAGTVVEIWPHPGTALPDGIETPAQAFTADIAAEFVPCGTDVQQGWSYDGKVFAAPAQIVFPVPEPMVEVSLLLDALSTSKRAAISQDNRDRLIARGAKGPVTADDPKVVRAATDVAVKVPGFTPAAWFDLALAPAS